MKKIGIAISIILVVGYFVIKTKAQQYPPVFQNYQTSLTYFWDSRTNLCFAYVEIDNLYRTPSLGFTITNVPCTDSVKKIINKEQ
jgi:hypothetical protein